jgi:hypothetical protein
MLKDKALEIAKGEIGKCEIPKGSNWGPHVQVYLASVGIMEPASWCMAFVYWCFATASKAVSLQNPLLQNRWGNESMVQCAFK